jgi:hypothetical protein
LLAILVYFRFGQGGVAPKPEKLEPGPLAPHPGLDELQDAIGGMNVPRSQPGPQTIALAGKAKKRMETVLGKMAIVGNPLLLAVGRIRAPSKASNPTALPRTSFSNLESRD